MAFLTDLLKQVFTTTATGAVALRAIISGDQNLGGGYISNDQTTTNMMSKGTVYRFDGVADYIAIPRIASLWQSANTVSFWVYLNDGNPASSQYLFGSIDGSIRYTILVSSTGIIQSLLGSNTATANRLDLTSNTVFSDGPTGWTHIAVVHNSDYSAGVIYVNGIDETASSVLQGTIDIPTLSTAIMEAPYVGCNNSNGVAAGWAQMEMAGFQIDNFERTAQEVKDLISGNIPFKWQWGSTLSDAWVNSGGAYAYDTFTTSGQQVTQAVNSANFAQMAFNHGAVEVGQQFRISYDLTLTSGTAPTFDIRATNALGVSLSSDASVLTAGTGQSNTITVSTAGAAGWISLWLGSGVASDFALANVSIQQLGAVALYDQTSISETYWYDKANGNDGAVTGASVLNPPSVTPLSCLHSLVLDIRPGGAPATNLTIANFSSGRAFNYPALTTATNMTNDGGAFGSFTLTATGTKITIDVGKTVVGILGSSWVTLNINNSSTTDLYFANCIITSGNIELRLTERANSSSLTNWLTVMQAGDAVFPNITYVTAT